MKRIAVLMTCYNRVKTTLACLQRLFVQALPDGYAFDVWLVDDASPDGTGEKVRVAFPSVHVIAGTGKLFWCKGMRLAWDKAAEACDYDFYLWLNDDVQLLPNAIFGALKDYENIGAISDGTISGCLTDGENSKVVAYGIGRQIGGPCIEPDGTHVISCYGSTGGNFLLVPKTIFSRVGPICGYYHHGYGDFDYGMQVRKHGFATYAASKIVGSCPVQKSNNIDLNSMSLPARFKLFFAGKGFRVDDVFVFRYRNFGFLHAVVSSLHVIAHVIFPAIVR